MKVPRGIQAVFLYYAFVALILVLAGPFLLLSKKRRAGIGQKLGFIPHPIAQRLLKLKQPIWFHTVSVGEFNAALPLLEAILKQYPQVELVVSTATASGQKLASERLNGRATLIYFPLDLPFALNAWLDAIAPSAVMIVETEIWPGFTFECRRRGIPMLILNGRISLRSFKRYFALRAFFGPVIRRFSAVVAQSKTESDRYQSIAGADLKTVFFGNLKFDGLQPIDDSERQALMRTLGLSPEDLVFVAGSTHEGEESAVLKLLNHWRARTDAPRSLRLIVAPRHPERWQHVAQTIVQSGYSVKRYSKNESFTQDSDVFLLDTIGQLFRYYSLATVAFVGGTLAEVGGHNLTEPFAYAVPVLSGPHLFKTMDVAGSLKDAGALTIVKDVDELISAAEGLLQSPESRSKRGNTGKQWLSQSQGAVSRTLGFIKPYLEAAAKAARIESDEVLKS